MAGKQEIAFGLKVEGVEQTIKSVKDLKSAIKELQDEAENADIGSEQYKNAIENIDKLNDKLKEVSQTEKQSVKATEDLAKAEKEAAKETGDLRKQFEVLEDELFMLAGQGKQNTKEFRALSNEAAKLNAKIDEVNQTLGGGTSGVDKLSGSFGMLQEGFTSMNFDKIKGGFKGIGASMSAIPIFLIIEGIKLLIDNFDAVVSFGKDLFNIVNEDAEAVKRLNASIEENASLNADMIKIVDKNNKLSLLYAKEAGKSEAELQEVERHGFEQRIKYTQDYYKETVDTYNKLLANDESTQEDITKAAKAMVDAKTAFSNDETNLLIFNTQKKIDANTKAAEKEKAEIEATKAANLVAIKAIEDAKIAAIKDEELRAFAQEVLNNERRLKEIKDGKEIPELKRQEKEAQEILFQNNLAKINADGAAKRKAEEDRIAAEKKAADEKAAADKKAADEKALADKNAQLTAEADLAVLKQGNDLADLTNQLTVKRDIELQNANLTATQKLLIEEKYNQDVEALNKASESAKFDMAKKGLEGLQSLSDIFFTVKLNKTVKGSKEEEAILKKQFELNKAFQLSMTAVQGVQNGIDAYGAGLKAASVTGIAAATAPIVGAAYAAISGLGTLASLAKIKSTKFGGGGGATGGGGGAAPMPSIPAPPTIATSSNNTNQSTTFDESGKNLNQTQPQINVTATVGVDEIAKKSNRVSVLEQQSTF